MYPLTVAQIAAALAIPAEPGWDRLDVTGVEFDSRRSAPGTLFVALGGEHCHGVRFAADAVARGAVAVLTDRVPEPGVAARVAVLARRDGDAVVEALHTLARRSVAPLIDAGLTVVGVTGSAGKTSTKDLLAQVLGAAAGAPHVVAPPESFNNEIGHPHTVLRAGPDTRYLVLELAARGTGHIARLAAVAPPRIGAVLNVGSAHLGEFGSREAIAQAKGELVEALPAAADGGVAVLGGDDELVAAMRSRTSARVVTFGLGRGADVRAEDLRLDGGARASFRLATPEGAASVSLGLVGRHQVHNALAAAAVARAAGLDVAAVAASLSAARPVSRWRMEVTELADGTTVVNDAYNANPESMRAAIDALSRIGAGRRRWAVLGHMAELGAGADAAHREVGRAAAESGASVVAVGVGARGIYDGALGAGASPAVRAYAVEGIDEAVDLLLDQVRPGDALVVKASRSGGLERLAERLCAGLGGGIPSMRAADSGAAGTARGETA